jgi:plasmid stabilization system protein ParE
MDDLSQELQTKIREAARLPGDPPVEQPEAHVDKLVVSEDLGFVPLQKYYGVEELDEKTKSQLSDVWDYYKSQEGVADTGDILKAVRAAHMNMVQPEIGQTKLSQLADYVRIIREMNDVTKQKQAYERLKS